MWADESRIVAVGHDCNPTLVSNNGGWKVERQLDEKKGGAGTVTIPLVDTEP